MGTKKPELKVVPVKKGKTTNAVKQPKDTTALIQEQMDVLLKQRNRLLNLLDQIWDVSGANYSIGQWAEKALEPDERGFCNDYHDSMISHMLYLREEIREAKEYIGKNEAGKYW